MRRLLILAGYAQIFVIFALLGTGLEWVYGRFWDLVGTAPWLYPGSFLHYTCLEGMPLWGLGGILGFSIYQALTSREAKRLLGVIPPLLLAAVWIIVYSAAT